MHLPVSIAYSCVGTYRSASTKTAGVTGILREAINIMTVDRHVESECHGNTALALPDSLHEGGAIAGWSLLYKRGVATTLNNAP